MSLEPAAAPGSNEEFRNMADTAGSNGERTDFYAVGKPNVPGKVLRRTLLEGQLHQVMMFSEGNRLKEDFYFDRNTGVKLHDNMFEHKKPTIVDMGPVHSILLETRAGNAAYGASGIRHSPANTPAIICAIQNAIGKWVGPPAAPDEVLKALCKA
jgi:CO/xanthine dehydrogenase Mo-binding subunit